MDESQEQAWQRLRAADPAAGAEPDPARLRARVDAVLSGSPAGSDAQTDPGDPRPDARPADLPVRDVRRSRRRTAGLAVAAAAAALVMAGGGYLAGVAAPGSHPLAAAARAAQAETAQTGVGSAGESAGEASAGTVPTAVPAQTSGPVRHVGLGLSTAEGTGQVLRVTPTTLTSAQVQRIADVIGAGPAAADGSGFSASSAAATLTVSADSGISRVTAARSGLGCAATGCADVSPDAARAAALTWLTGAGVDADGLQVTVADTAAGRRVDLLVAVDGVTTPLGWQVWVDSGGVVAVTGRLGTVTSLGGRPLLSPAAAVSRLDDTGFLGWAATMAGASTDWASGGVVPVATGGLLAPGPVVEQSSDGSVGSAGSVPASVAPTPAGPMPTPAVPTAVPTTVQPGASVPWPVTTLTVSQVQEGLALVDGLLVPAYAFTDSAGVVTVVPALADSALTQVAG